jgi:hypothetical protein
MRGPLLLVPVLLAVRAAPAERRFDRWWSRLGALLLVDSVEYDDLDSPSRSHQLVTPADDRRPAAALVTRAHDAGLAAGRKSSAQWHVTSVGFDLAVAEQCARYRECGRDVDTCGGQVLAPEYHENAFSRACRRWSDRIAVVRRDVDLTASGVRRWGA